MLTSHKNNTFINIPKSKFVSCEGSCMNELGTDQATVIKEKFLTPNKKPVVRIGTIGDGSCFFHSVCLCLNKNAIWMNQSYIEANDKERKTIVKLFRNYLANHTTEEILQEIYKEIVNHVDKPELIKIKKKSLVLRNMIN